MRANNDGPILLVEHHPLVADATSALLRQHDPQRRIEIRTSARQAVQAARSAAYWFRVFLNVDVPGSQGPSLIREFADLGYASRSCVIAAIEKPGLAAEARAIGLLGYVAVGDSPTAVFAAALHRVLRGQLTFPASAATALRLTRRQEQLVGYLKEGLSSRQIAKNLGVAEGTVDNHVAGLLRAMGVTNRAQAVARAAELGFINLRGEASAVV